MLASLNANVFAADHAIGQGSMGVVWRGRHLPSGQAIALKWLHPKAHRVADLGREARMMARLDHPHLLPVYDFGRLDEAPAGLADRACLVMAFANAGSLAPYRGRLPWPVCRAVLRQVLAGLAHLGARGLVHQDIKPANLLLTRRETGVQVMLADLGVGRLNGSGPIAGTPAFSAPESGSAMGPWTDLFSVGRTAQALLAGAPDAPLPSDMPGPVRQWIARLVHPDPALRPQSAAEAKQLLDQVDPGDGAIVLPTASVVAAVDGSTVPVHTPVLLQAQPQASSLTALPRQPLVAPATWGRPVPPRPPTLWQGVALWRMRRPPLVGRMGLRDRLWQEFRAASAGRPRGTVLAGLPGVGTSRLLAWAAETAHIRAGARILDVSTDGASLLSRLDPHGASLDAAAPWGAQIDGLIAAAAAAGPTVWIADGELAPVVRRLLRTLLQSDAPAWVLLGTRPAQVDSLRRDLEAGDALVLEVPPLSAADMVHLLRQRVRIASRLAERIAIRAPGAPGLAVTVLDGLLPDLIETPVGLDLPGTVHLPAEATDVWRRAVDAVWRGATRDEQDSIIALAVLAPGSWAEWRALCARAEVPTAVGLLDAFVNTDLLSTGDGLNVAHAGVRAALLSVRPSVTTRLHQLMLLVRTTPFALERVQHALDGNLPALALTELEALAEADIDTDVLPRLLPLIERCRTSIQTSAGLDILEARIALTLGERDRADACLKRVEALAIERPRLRLFMLETRSRLMLVLGEYAACGALIPRLYAAAGNDPVLYYRAQVAHARSASISGRDAEAVDALLARAPAATIPARLRLRGELLLIGALKACNRVDDGFARLDGLFAAADAAQEPGMWPHVHCYAGDLYMGRGDVAKARAHFEAAVARSDDRMPVAAYFHLNIIIADLRAGHGQDALRRLESLYGRCDSWPVRIEQLMFALWLHAAAQTTTTAQFEPLLARLDRLIDASASPDTRAALRAAHAELPAAWATLLEPILTRLT